MNPKTPHYLNKLIASGASAHKLNQFLRGGLDLNRIIAEPEWFKPLLGFTRTDFALYFYLTDKLSKELTMEQIDRYFQNTDDRFKFAVSAERLHMGALKELATYQSEDYFVIGSTVARMVDEFNVSTVSAWRMKYWGCFNPKVDAEATHEGIVFKTPYSPPVAAIQAWLNN